MPGQKPSLLSHLTLRQFSISLALVVIALAAALAPSAHAQTYAVLFNFDDTNSTGAQPEGSVVFDPSGNLYSTTELGGANQSNYGTVFKLAPNGTQTVLHTFIFTNNGSDGESPVAGPIRDSAGNLYGTTGFAGTHGMGTIYEIDSAGTESILHNFSGGATDGAYPGFGNLILDAAGNLYGTTEEGGSFNTGVVYQLSPTGVLTVLYSFSNGTDGGFPYSSLVMDSSGNLYGTAIQGGNGGSSGGGVIFRLSPNGSGGYQETVLHSFKGGTDGREPIAGPALSPAGHLYGNTGQGGSGGCGVIYEAGTNGGEKVLYAFSALGSGDGCVPVGVLSFEGGTLYGTTQSGGAFGQGIIFSISSTGVETILHSFNPATDGGAPNGGVVRGPHGALYGTASIGGTSNQGTVFKIVP
jgi:uncharacterized repeat protein (TIGR03803 family)